MYVPFYGLKEEPFCQSPDPRFLHLAEPHRTVLTTLLKAILTRKGFMVITGPVGTGKTTLLHATLQILSEKNSNLASALLFNPTLTRDEFFEALLDEYEIPCDSTSKTQRLLAIQRLLTATQQKGGTGILVIDEAHLLSVELLEEIRLLNNVESYSGKLLQIVLCGQPELWSVLGRPELLALRQRVADRCTLRALNLPESRAYVAERLHLAGLCGRSLFTSAALESVYRFSRGVPRLINLVCDKSLYLGCASRREQIDPSTVQEAAEELGLSEDELDAMVAGEAGGAGGHKGHSSRKERSTTDQSVKSAVDVLIATLREARATAAENL